MASLTKVILMLVALAQIRAEALDLVSATVSAYTFYSNK